MMERAPVVFASRHLTRVQMSVLVESIAADDGTVDYESFVASFEIHTG